MDENEAGRLLQLLQRRRPELAARIYWNGMTQAHEVEITSGDPRGVRVWLRSPVLALRYIAWLNRQAGKA